MAKLDISRLIAQSDGRLFDPVEKKYYGSTDPVEETLPDISLDTPSLPSLQKSSLRLEDLPAEAKQINVINAIIGYEMLGLPNSEIAYALGCPIDELTAIQDTAAYDRMRSMILEAVSESMQHDAKALISKSAIDATNTMVLTLKSKSETNKLRAAEGILDRAGISAKDMNNGLEGNLVIKIVKDRKTSVEVTLN